MSGLTQRSYGPVACAAALACVVLLGQQVWAQNQPQSQQSRPLSQLGITVSETGDQNGLKVDNVQPNSPAQQAGIASGDRLLRINGQPIKSFSDVQPTLQQTQPGAQVTLKFSHQGQQKTARVSLGSSMGGGQQAQTQQFSQLGITVSETGDQNGLKVDNVQPNSPAQQAGIASGDRLLRINGQAINSYSDVQPTLQQTQPGAQVTLKFSHQGQQKTARVALGRMMRSPVRERMGREQTPQFEGGEGQAWLGVALAKDMQPLPGVLVSQVFPSGPAARAGLFAGDRIISIDGQEANTRQEIVQIIQQKSPGDQIELVVFREGDRETVQATLGDRNEFFPEVPQDEFEDEPQSYDPEQQWSGENCPESAMRLEQERHAALQRQRIENIVTELRDEVRALREALPQSADQSGAPASPKKP